jgi:methyl-accepting chemotaxis protein
MDQQRFKRRIKVIDSPFQYRMVALFLSVVVAGFLLFSAGLVFYYWGSYVSGDNLFKEIITLHKQVTRTLPAQESGTGKKETYTTTLDVPGVNRLELVLPPILINNLAIMAFVIFVGIFATHRIAGPVYRVEKEIDRVLAGEKGVRISLRKGDNFPALAGKVNKLIERLENSGGGDG